MSSISGICGCAFVVVNLSGDATAQTVSDNSGNYTFGGLSNGSYTITPDGDRFTSFTFTPTSHNETVSGSDVPGVDFTCPPVNYTFKGNVGGYSKSVVYHLNLGQTLSDGTATADGDGNYSVTTPSNSALNGVLMRAHANGDWY